jgi:hypothetical protein
VKDPNKFHAIEVLQGIQLENIGNTSKRGGRRLDKVGARAQDLHGGSVLKKQFLL